MVADQVRRVGARGYAALKAHAAVLVAFTASRLALLAIGLLTQIHIRPITPQGNPLYLSSRQALNVWGAADTGWYVDLALHGYQRDLAANGQANWAFFPAFPGLAAALARLTGLTAFQAMLVISNLAFLVGLLLIHRLAREEFDRRTADLCVLLLCVAPGSYIFSAAYTEALFLALVAGALLLIRQRRWLVAGLATAGAVMTRNLGIFLLLPYGWTALERLRERPRLAEYARIAAGVAAPLLALAVFMLHLKQRTGDALAFLHIQQAWSRSLEKPFALTLHGLLHPASVGDSDLFSLASAWLAIALLAVLAASRRWALLSLAMAFTLVPLATGLQSFGRYALVVVPLWMTLAQLLADRPRAAMAGVVMLAMLNGFMMVAWTLTLAVVV